MNNLSHILLTGGTGFFGKALLRHWAHHEQLGIRVPRVTLISRNPELFHNRNSSLVMRPWLQMLKADVCDFGSLPRDFSFTHVLHAAAESTFGPNLSPQERFDQIVSGTRNMLELSVSCGATRFLLTSSGGAYGPQPAEMKSIPENYNGMPDPLASSNAYGVAKRQAEHLCALYGNQYRIETVIARCFAFVGEDLPQDAHFAIGNFIRDALERSEITVNGNGSPISIADTAHLVRDILAPEKHVYIKGAPLGDNTDRNRYLPDISKAKLELGLEVTVPLVQAIRLSANTTSAL
jgi:dTDP-glucose 4,6-dehydratase